MNIKIAERDERLKNEANARKVLHYEQVVHTAETKLIVEMWESAKTTTYNGRRKTRKRILAEVAFVQGMAEMLFRFTDDRTPIELLTRLDRWANRGENAPNLSREE